MIHPIHRPLASPKLAKIRAEAATREGAARLLAALAPSPARLLEELEELTPGPPGVELETSIRHRVIVAAVSTPPALDVNVEELDDVVDVLEGVAAEAIAALLRPGDGVEDGDDVGIVERVEGRDVLVRWSSCDVVTRCDVVDLRRSSRDRSARARRLLGAPERARTMRGRRKR